MNDWLKTVLEKVPHGEEGSINLKKEDAFKFSEMLLNNGFAVCLTAGDHIEDDIKVSWLYAGSVDLLNYSNYNNVVFTSGDYIEDYPQAYFESLKKDREEIYWVKDEVE